MKYKPTILSLCDYSGNWPWFYSQDGYTVVLVDPAHRKVQQKGNVIKLPLTVESLLSRLLHMRGSPAVFGLSNVHGILMAPPCTEFAASGAQYWKDKDVDGRTGKAVTLVRNCLAIKDTLRPKWWALENPVGRLGKLVPEVGEVVLYFDPCDYGDPYTKKTCLWGSFTKPEPNPVRANKVCPQGSKLQRLGGGGGEKTKRLRSITGLGFAKAFFEANP